MALQTELKTQGAYLFKNRSYLPLLFLVAGLVVYLYGEYTEPVDLEKLTFGYYEFICLAVSLTGLFIKIITIGYTPKNTSSRNTSEGQIADEINTTGTYSLSRHPLYLGNFFIWLGVAMLSENLWFTIAFILLYWLYYEGIMYPEENFLIDKFGDVYLDWAIHIPAFLPSLKNYVRPKYPFLSQQDFEEGKEWIGRYFSTILVI